MKLLCVPLFLLPRTEFANHAHLSSSLSLTYFGFGKVIRPASALPCPLTSFSSELSNAHIPIDEPLPGLSGCSFSYRSSPVPTHCSSQLSPRSFIPSRAPGVPFCLPVEENLLDGAILLFLATLRGRCSHSGYPPPLMLAGLPFFSLYCQPSCDWTVRISS